MKLIKTLVAVAALGALFSAHADSNLQTGAASQSPGAVAHLDFRVTVPKVLFLRVGTGGPGYVNNAAVDRMDFTLTMAEIVAPGTLVAGVKNTIGSLTVDLVGNGGNVSFTAAGAGTGLVHSTVPTDIIPWSQIAPASSNPTLPHPAISGTASTLTASANRVFNQTATWSFNYANAVQVGDGQYDGTVTYTAALP
jgi:hypothetical protein